MNLKVTAIGYLNIWTHASRIGYTGVVFDQAHAMKTVLLNCRTVFVACGLTKSSVLFTPPRPILHRALHACISQGDFVLFVTFHNIIKLQYETF